MSLKKSTLLFSICIPLAILATVSVQADPSDWKPIEKGKSFSGVSVTGRVVPQDGALNLESARVQGRVLSILKREGEHVKEGDFLYSISSGECVSLVEEKRVAEDRKIAELITSADRREKQLGIKLIHDQCMIVATHSGVITKRNLESGGVFNLGDTLATILDIHRLGIEIDISEQDQSQVKTGEKVSFQFPSHPDKKYVARIQTIVPTIDSVTRSVKARLENIALPKDTTLDALIFGEIDNGDHQTALQVPASALVFKHNQQYVISGDEKSPRAVAVQVISEADASVSIRPVKPGELKAGDLIATKGAIFIFQKLQGAT
jgi:multidrug efflux pump subunit AcrA (membrane-fusion protein)